MPTKVDWRDMDSAPRDGRELLLVVGGKVRHGVYLQLAPHELEGEPDTFSGWYGCDLVNMINERITPTRWAPMPACPPDD